ncbi:MAG: hypothetical protein ACPGQL_07255 [Thermoplasmatota archaeon]
MDSFDDLVDAARDALDRLSAHPAIDDELECEVSLMIQRLSEMKDEVGPEVAPGAILVTPSGSMTRL